jgi:hypothetical protein
VPDEVARLHPVSRRHLDVLTGELGILQHAVGSRPDPGHGYCLDDVARALQVDLLHAKVLGWAAVSESAWRGLCFIEAALDEPSGRFRNFRAIDGAWIGGPGSNDSFGRAMLALGEAVAAAPDAALVERAAALFERALPAASRVTSPRAQAAVVLGCAAMSASPTSAARAATASPRRTASTASAARVPAGRHHPPAYTPQAVMRTLATGLHARFLDYAAPGWPWPEDVLTYENALLPRALIVAGHDLGAGTMLSIGLQVLDWLIRVQTAAAGHLTSIGNGWWPRAGIRARFDQQPIEATALLLAAEAALGATGAPRYRAAMERAYAWFLGDNDLGVRLADPARGAGSDGLTPRGRNTNEGAESTLMWLMAAERIRSLRVDGEVEADPVAGRVEHRCYRGSHLDRSQSSSARPSSRRTRRATAVSHRSRATSPA